MSTYLLKRLLADPLFLAFTDETIEEGKRLFLNQDIREVSFGGETYQVEVMDGQTSYWVSLQLNRHSGQCQGWCSCLAGDHLHCAHSVAALLLVNPRDSFSSRWKTSYWYALAQIGHNREGKPSSYPRDSHEFTWGSHGASCSLVSQSLEGEEWMQEALSWQIIDHPEEQLEFSHLELASRMAWQKGHRDHAMDFVFSFWYCFSRHLFFTQIMGRQYNIRYTNLGQGLPHRVEITTPLFRFSIPLESEDWARLIPTLCQVDSPIRAHASSEGTIESIRYEADHAEIVIERGKQNEQNIKHIEIGEWRWNGCDAFFLLKGPCDTFPDRILTERIAEFLDAIVPWIDYLPLQFGHHEDVHFIDYDLSYSTEGYFIASPYLEGGGEMEQGRFFPPWIYLEKAGFFRIKEDKCCVEKERIHPQDIGAWLKEKRWKVKGIPPSGSIVPARWSFSWEKEGLSFFYSQEGMVDCGDLLYMEGKGFYSKDSPLFSCQRPIPRKGFSRWLQEHREVVDQVDKFFCEESPIRKWSIHLSWDPSQGLFIRPHVVVANGFPPFSSFEWIDRVAYIPEKGHYFFEEGEQPKERYRKEHLVPLGDLSAFMINDWEDLMPHVEEIPKALVAPQVIKLIVRDIETDTLSKRWNLTADFQTEIGSLDLETLFQHLGEDRLFAFTEAGMLDMSLSVFQWMRKHIDQGNILSKTEISLSVSQWLLLRIEPWIILPEGGKSGALVSADLLPSYSLVALDAKLRPYQHAGFCWLWMLYYYGLGGLLCDDMGLGKSHQTMALMAARLVEQGESRMPFLIVCPTSVLYHWENLLERFLPTARMISFHGAERREHLKRPYDVVLTSYGMLRQDRALLGSLSFDIACFDEIHVAKNPQSQVHRAIHTVQARMKLGLTGTPIENRLMDLKALFDLVMPGYFPNRTCYLRNFVDPIEKQNNQSVADQLKKLIHPLLMKRKKEEVLSSLPEKVEQIMRVPLSKEQQEMQAGVMREYQAQVGNELTTFRLFSLFNRLKQICNHPCLVSGSYQEYHHHESGKWNLFVALLSESRMNKQKIVVFTHYLGMMDLIQHYLEEHNILYASIRGATRDRKKQIERFQTDPDCEVFVASLQAAGLGVELTAASVVIHYDRWWNPAKENQATDRVHRMGQLRGVQVFKMVSVGSIEEEIDALLKRKGKLASGVVGHDTASTSKLIGREALLEILSRLQLAVDRDV
ncbi:MAG: DEAD/DEAH box helicase [Chlamydiota bacterium]|nr:DEAD/DEAH box helicase [Chlamydiota bacterium]